MDRRARKSFVMVGAAASVLVGTSCVRSDGLGPSQVAVRRTSYGVPHIVAADWEGAAYGQGYVTAQDHVCLLAREFVKLRSQLARHFGPGDGDANVNSDFGYLAFQLRAHARAGVDEQPAETRAALRGYARGYNRYLSETPSDKRPPACAGAAWVTAIDEVDLMARSLDLSLANFSRGLIPLAATAMPPLVRTARALDAATVAIEEPLPASNAWAIGRELSVHGGGMLVANPHLPWTDDLRFHELHMTIPGLLDAYGAALIGIVGINVGFNEHLAWTYTTSSSIQDTFYQLALEEDDPTAYRYDGSYRRMLATDVAIDVLQADGSIQSLSRVLYASHHGPVLNVPQLGWTAQAAFALRSANIDAYSATTETLRRMSATSLEAFRELERAQRGTPWANAIVADDVGNAYFVDASRVPNLSQQTVERWLAARAEGGLAAQLFQRRIVLLDGSTTESEWQEMPAPTGKNLVPFDQAPQVTRSDFVFNSNDAYWMVNPASPLSGAPVLYGVANGPISPRSRMNLSLLTGHTERGASGDDGVFSFDELKAAILSNGTLASWAKDGVVQRCRAGVAARGGTEADSLSRACEVLAAWDGTVDAGSSGAVLWRETLAQFSRSDLVTKGALWAVGFDPQNPVETPNTAALVPDSGPDPVPGFVLKALTVLQSAGIEPTARLGDVQFATNNGTHVGVHGGLNSDGSANVVAHNPAPSDPSRVLSPRTGLTREGYPINYGTSFLMILEFTANGPHAEGMLTYGESSDPRTTHVSDQLELFAKKTWRPFLFRETEILADPTLSVLELDSSL